MMVTSKICFRPRDIALMRSAVVGSPSFEVCGLLGGRKQRTIAYVERVTPIANIAADPHNQFLMEPQQQLAELFALAKQGLQLVGIYHSHPNGPLYPSEMDVQNWAYPEAVCLIGWGVQVGAWLLQGGQVLPVELMEMG